MKVDPKNRERLSLALLVVVVLGLSAVLIGRTLSRGDDFLVFYRVASRFWDGVRPYDQVTYGNMVFKYPPWILPIFLPFALLDAWGAKFTWGCIEAASLVAIAIRFHRGFGGLPSVRPWLQSLFLVSLFALFGSHGMTGQITLPILALALWTDPVRDSFLKFFFLVFGFSSKMTSLFPLIQVVTANPRRKKLVLGSLGTALLFVLLSLPIYMKSYDRKYGLMREQWAAAMFSGTDDTNSVRIGFTTREVQGLPSFLLRKGGLDEKNSNHVMAAIAFSALLIGGLWWWFSRKLPATAQWMGWLALLPAVQPLAWFHVFLFTLPVLVFGAEADLRAGRTLRVWGYFGCALLIGAVTSKTLGGFGAELEMASIKLWGSLIAVSLFRTSTLWRA